jgi:hypothetical protein
MLSWIHFGDLHVSDEDGWESLRRLRRLTDQAETHLAWSIDFAFLPGDNANHGEPEQYGQIRDVLDDLALRWFAIPGDHDFEPKSLVNFYEGLKTSALPLSVSVRGHRCLFLDIVSPGGGGPDFRLGAAQTDWLRNQLEQARSDPQRPVVFMHAFPSDLAEGAEEIARLFSEYGVACVDTGHTHYNEVLNDGGVVYTATRSTGQIEEGPPGFSVHTVDGSVASWRFKPLESGWPFVLITSPADYRMVVDPSLSDQAPRAAFTVRARVFGEDVERVELAFDDRAAVAMTPVAGWVGLWTADVDGPPEGRRRLTVTAVSSDGQVDRDSIEVRILAKDDAAERRLKPNPGDHVHSIGAWPERGLLGTQLGPNKKGTIAW